jgi:hypothetical protein
MIDAMRIGLGIRGTQCRQEASITLDITQFTKEAQTIYFHIRNALQGATDQCVAASMT